MSWIDDLQQWVAHLDAQSGSNNTMVSLTVAQIREIARWRASHQRLERLRADVEEYPNITAKGLILRIKQ